MLAPCALTFGPALQQLGPHALVVPVVGADSLAATTRTTVEKAEKVPEPEQFFGHMTVALPETAEELAWAETVLGAPLNGHWTATEVCVFASEVIDGVKSYRVLERIPLASPAQVGEG